MSAADTNEPQSIYLRPYPKIILLYPTFFAALFCGILTWLFAPSKAEVRQAAPAVAAQMDNPSAEHPIEAVVVRNDHHETIALAFMAIFSINLIVLAFDFPRTTSLTIFFFIAFVIMGIVLLYQFYPEIFPNILQWLGRIRPNANSTFYFLFATLLGLIYLAVLVAVRMDYWEVRPNELLHHHGFLSNLERFSAPNLRISKEIDDVFEYMLLRSGRLILHPSSEPRAFVLDNVPFIDAKEKQITQMLGALQVQVRHEGGAHAGTPFTDAH